MQIKNNKMHTVTIQTRHFKWVFSLSLLTKNLFMNYNTDYNIRRQKEKALKTVYTVHTSATFSGNCKGRTKAGAFVALPQTTALQAANETKSFT